MKSKEFSLSVASSKASRSWRGGKKGSVTNWHFSHSFCLIFLNTYNHYLSSPCLIKQFTVI